MPVFTAVADENCKSSCSIFLDDLFKMEKKCTGLRDLSNPTKNNLKNLTKYDTLVKEEITWSGRGEEDIAQVKSFRRLLLYWSDFQKGRSDCKVAHSSQGLVDFA